MSVKNLDLNLLPQLQVLLELRNISRAAGRLQLSQPAASAAMARLRRHFDDELLVRNGRTYDLTSSAPPQPSTFGCWD
jgi:DNA-binding transcriptional LysR family regulator